MFTRVFLVAILLAGIVATGAAGQEVVLHVYGGYPPEIAPPHDTLEQYFRLYEQLHPGIKIESLGREHNPDKLIAMFLAGEAPDVIELASEVLVDFYNKGFLAEAPSSLAEKLRETSFPITVEALTVGNAVIAVPNESMVTGLLYNERILGEVGLAGPPETMDDLELYGRRLVSVRGDGTFERVGLAEAGENWSLNHFGLAFLKAEGGAVLDEGGTIVLDQAPVYRVIERFSSWAGQSGGAPFLGLGWNWAAEFWSGNAGLGLGYPFWLGESKKASPDQYPDEFGVARLPRGSAGYGALHYGHGYAVPKASRHQDEAWKLLEWLNQAIVGEGTPSGHVMAVVGSLPLNRADIGSSYYGDEVGLYDGFIAGLDHAVDIAELAPYGISNAHLGTIIQSVLSGQASPQQAVHNAVNEIRAQMERYRSGNP